MRERKYIAGLVLYSVFMYIIGAIIYYIYLMPKNMSDRFKTLLPFCITPLM
jgi:Sec-independent protein secretion pathway component TatC